MKEATPLDVALHNLRLELDPDSGYIRWAPDNPKHPRNWPLARKVYDIGIIILLECYTTAISTSGHSAAARWSQERLDISITLAQFMFVSTYLLGQALGNVVFPPYSECFGRKKLYVASTVAYSGLCAMIGAVDSPAAAVVGRYLTGVLSSIPTVIIVGSMEDIFNAKARIWTMLPYIGVAQIGVSLGPVMSAYITQAFGWSLDRLSYFPERLRIFELKRELIPCRPSTMTNHRTGRLSFEQTFCGQSGSFLTEPIVFSICLIVGTALGIIYLFTEALPHIYEDMGLNQEQSSLPFFALGFASIFNIPGRIIDHQAAKKKDKGEHLASPEYKLKGLTFAAPVLALGLWWFAWTIPPGFKVFPGPCLWSPYSQSDTDAMS
ncbi:MFS multidrug transporter [Penicillium chermesinum]|nr:MFS multidrug transporter [Penicillium chermesinum]